MNKIKVLVNDNSFEEYGLVKIANSGFNSPFCIKNSILLQNKTMGVSDSLSSYSKLLIIKSFSLRFQEGSASGNQELQ